MPLAPDTAESLIAILRRVPLFERLDEPTLREVSAAMRPVTAEAGAFVVREGAPGDAFFVLDSGEVRVVAGDPETGVELARLGPGRYFGEMALVTGEPRSASVVALEACRLLALHDADFQRLVDHYPAFRLAVKRVADSRAAGNRVFENETYKLVDLDESQGAVSIGSDAANRLVLDAHDGVAPFHAEVRWSDGAPLVVDLGSPSGTYLNGAAVTEARLSEGDIIWIGAARLFLHDGALRFFQPSRGVRVDARDLGRQVGKRTILQGVNLTFYPGEMVAIVGPSGAGKTTLLHLLLGLDAPTTGTVQYDGLPLSAHGQSIRSRLGYVPQQDIVHPELTARESLEAAARLRPETGAESRVLRQRIDGVLREVRLDQHADTRVGRLSGGQRKRACVAVELLTEPRIVFLDEPTSGLDPALDDQMMHLFRALADAGRTVVLTTHATRNLRICDRVVVVSGGRVVFTGTPTEALDFFQVEDFSEIYAPLLQVDAGELRDRFEESPLYARVIEARMDSVGPAAAARAGPQPRDALKRARTVGRQFSGLLRRDLQILTRDRVNLALKIAGPPLMAAALLLTFDSKIFAEGASQGGNVREAITVLYLASAICLFIAAITSSNAITRELAIYRRERIVNLSPVAYVASKFWWLGVTSILQGGLVVLVLAARIDFPSPKSEVLPLMFAALALTAAAGGSLGLFISAMSPNADRAAVLAVLAIIPQLIFGGSTVPRAEMQWVALRISDVMTSKWVLELLGDITNLQRRIDLQSVVTVSLGEFGNFDVRVTSPFQTAFSVDPLWRWLFLWGWVLVFAVGTWAALMLRERRR
jgi:ABC-type multidrug transport system ATPase subunit